MQPSTRHAEPTATATHTQAPTRRRCSAGAVCARLVDCTCLHAQGRHLRKIHNEIVRPTHSGHASPSAWHGSASPCRCTRTATMYHTVRCGGPTRANAILASDLTRPLANVTTPHHLSWGNQARALTGHRAATQAQCTGQATTQPHATHPRTQLWCVAQTLTVTPRSQQWQRHETSKAQPCRRGGPPFSHPHMPLPSPAACQLVQPQHRHNATHNATHDADCAAGCR